ncbi:DUF1707 domain-containing protein [Nocardia farcinica]|nr:DUF1707 domain-containing protein [Nocardia farcinica]MBC9819179.1 DUF1707 domain-containing protein [Nocardia farcinica]
MQRVSTTSGRTRARDIDRANASSVLDAAYAEGQLGAAEYHDRTARAAAAKTVGDLAGLLADLQVPATVRDLVPSSAAAPRKPLRRSASPSGYPGHTRARADDRRRVHAQLDHARAEGQLTEDEHQARRDLADEARTLGDLAVLVDDLRLAPSAEPRPPRSRRRHWFQLGVAAAAVVAAVATATLTARAVRPEPPAPAAAPVAPVADLDGVAPVVIGTPNLLTETGLRQLVADLRTRFGDPTVDELSVHPELASLTKAVPGQPNRKVGYSYRWGFAPDGAPVTREPDTPTVDLTALDLTALAALIAEAPATLRVPDGTTSHIGVEIMDNDFYAAYGLPRGAVAVSVYARNEARESGHLLAAADGRIARTWEFGR